MSKYSFGTGLPTWNGVPMVGGVPITEGNYYFVDAGIGSDGNKGLSMAKPFATYAKALDSVTSNNNDVICLVGSGTHALTAMETISGNRIHTVGLDGTTRRYGQGAKVSIGVTTAATDLGAVLVTGVRNSFSNMKFISNNTVTEGLYTVLDGGEYTVWENCEIYKSTDLDETGAAEMVMNGDSSQVRGCTIGSNADALSGTIIRPCVLVTKATAAAGKVSRDVSFDNCQFWRRASHVNNRFIYGANATDTERMFHVKDCTFYATKLSSAVPAQAMAFGAEQTQGYPWMDNCRVLNVTKQSTTTGVYVTGAVPTYATSGIAVKA